MNQQQRKSDNKYQIYRETKQKPGLHSHIFGSSF